MTHRYAELTHLNVRVPDLREAEWYYRELLDLEVAWRDTDGALPMAAGWEEIERAGVEVAVVAMQADRLRLALERGEPGGTQLLGHVGVQASREQLVRVRERAVALGVSVLARRDDELFMFRDRHGVEWELDTRSFADWRTIGRQVEERREADRSQR